MIVQIFWCYNDHHIKITKAGIIRFVKGFHWEKFEHGAFINYKSLFLYGSCPANYIQAVTLFLKKKEINKEPVAMLAYILCKTEGRRIKNKQSLSSGKGQIWWERRVLEYMEDCQQAQKKAGMSFPCVVVCDVIRGLAPLWPYLPQPHTWATVELRVMESPEKILHFFLLADGENSCCQVEIIAGKCVFLCRSLFMFPAKFSGQSQKYLY